jgi:hypothetical protein
MPGDLSVPLDAHTLRDAVAPVSGQSACPDCSHLRCAGWESVTAPVEAPLLECVGTLRDTRQEEPTLEEFHPHGTHYWQAEAPIAPAFFPYNRCSVWRCRRCQRGFLQYTEFGGYYTDHRIREIDPSRVL